MTKQVSVCHSRLYATSKQHYITNVITKRLDIDPVAVMQWLTV